MCSYYNGHFVHNHKILPPFFSVFYNTFRQNIPFVNSIFQNDSLLCHQALN